MKLILLLIAPLLILAGCRQYCGVPKEAGVVSKAGIGEEGKMDKDEILKVATFAGGCFWCSQADFSKLPGVTKVVSGYTGGQKDNPTYEEVSSGTTGHFESIQVYYDPGKITYEALLDYYWKHVDPTDAGGQFYDRGSQYRTAIFYHDAEQKLAAEKSKAELDKSGRFKQPIATLILPFRKFWPAEEYHQDFWKKNPVRYHEYREGCGRDRRLAELWGKAAVKPFVH